MKSEWRTLKGRRRRSSNNHNGNRACLTHFDNHLGPNLFQQHKKKETKKRKRLETKSDNKKRTNLQGTADIRDEFAFSPPVLNYRSSPLCWTYPGDGAVFLTHVVVVIVVVVVLGLLQSPLSLSLLVSSSYLGAIVLSGFVDQTPMQLLPSADVQLPGPHTAAVELEVYQAVQAHDARAVVTVHEVLCERGREQVVARAVGADAELVLVDEAADGGLDGPVADVVVVGVDPAVDGADNVLFGERLEGDVGLVVLFWVFCFFLCWSFCGRLQVLSVDLELTYSFEGKWTASSRRLETDSRLLQEDMADGQVACPAALRQGCHTVAVQANGCLTVECVERCGGAGRKVGWKLQRPHPVAGFFIFLRPSNLEGVHLIQSR